MVSPIIYNFPSIFWQYYFFLVYWYTWYIIIIVMTVVVFFYSFSLLTPCSLGIPQPSRNMYFSEDIFWSKALIYWTLRIYFEINLNYIFCDVEIIFSWPSLSSSQLNLVPFLLLYIKFCKNVFKGGNLFKIFHSWFVIKSYIICFP